MDKTSVVAPKRARLGELLVARGLIDLRQLEHALELARAQGTRLGTQLLMAGCINEAELAQFLSDQLGLPSIHRLSEIDPSAPSALPAEVAVPHGVLPVRRSPEGLFVALADPSDEAALAAARAAAGCEVFPMVAPELVVAYGLRRFYADEVAPSERTGDVGPQFARDALGIEALS